MKYNFDEIIDRRNSNSVKHDWLIGKFGADDVIPLWVADMDFRIAQPILDALRSKVEHGVFGYALRSDEYEDAIVNWQERRNGWKIQDKSLISFSIGVIPSITALVRIFAKPGEKILIQPPVYPGFFSICKSTEMDILESRLVEKDGAFHFDSEDFELKLKEGPKAFILCNPQNPTGHAWRYEELKTMGDLCVKYSVPIISDEIHGDLMLFGNKHIPMAAVSSEIADNTITCTAPTKTFNIAGIQGSYVIFNNHEIKKEFENCWHEVDINAFSLAAILAAYSKGEEWLDQLIAYIEDNMRFVKEFCENEIPQIKVSLPEATYLLWMDFRGLGLEGKALEDFLIHKAKLGMNAGPDFDSHLSGHMRLNAACPREILRKAMNQLSDAIKSL
jgi:Bifunctional PLP-dependent enzyme with beta-cystathionase and maltose regulon repressor activities